MNSYEKLPPPADVSPGWKVDPSNSNQHRWWSGERWTEHSGVSAAPPVTHAPTPTATAAVASPAPLIPRNAEPFAPAPAAMVAPGVPVRPDVDIAARRMRLTIGAKREIRRLHSLLPPEEQVFDIARCDHAGRTGILVLTGRKLLFYSEDETEAKREDFPLDRVEGLTFEGGDLILRNHGEETRLTAVAKADGKRMVASANQALMSRARASAPFKVLPAGEAFWRRSNQMGVLNTDLAQQLGAETMGARLWRLEPGQASTRHRHRQTVEVYLLLEGTGKLLIGDELTVLEPMDSVLVEPESMRQPFNDTEADQLWLIFGAPAEHANTVDMSPAELAWHYPDGPKALPPELTP